MDVRQWLARLGLEKYAQALIENEVELRDLPELTEDDFVELGFPLGPRRRLMGSLEDLDLAAVAGTGEQHTGRTPGKEGQVAWARNPDERRPVTLLFADLSGSTALTEKLDPEDAHRVLYGAVRRMGDAVEAHRGTVCRFMGDGLMAMFGVPTAYESHSRQACYGALALQSSVGAYSAELEQEFGIGLQARVGLHAGEIVALQVGEGDRAEWDASGPAVPVAARLEQYAEPGSILLTESTFELAAPHFDATKLEPITVKGVSAPLSVMRLERAVESDGAGHPAHATPFVGRRTERAQLLAALETCMEEGGGQTLFVRGEAGVGKTRLVSEIAHTAEALGFAHHRALVLDFGAGKGQVPIAALARSLLGLRTNSTNPEGMRAAEQAKVKGLVMEAESLFLSDMLDLPIPGHSVGEFESMDPEIRARGRRDMFRDLAVRCSERQPCLIVVEDVHWADDTTLDFLRELMRASTNVPLVLLMTTRPSHDPLSGSWALATAGAPATVVNLRQFRQSESEQLAAEFAGLDESSVAACIERSDGNALFLLELLKATQRGLQDSLPTSVQTIAAARLDELERVDRDAIQAASVLGQRFDLETLRAVLRLPDYSPGPLLEAQLIRPEGQEFLFAHALVMEGVYASLLRDQRRKFHGRAAEWYEPRDLTLRARHLERAGNPVASVAYLEAAQEQIERFRFAVASALARDGLRITSHLAEQASLYDLLGQSQMGLGESRLAADAFSRALADAPDQRKSRLLTSLAHAYRNHGEYDGGLAALSQAEKFAATVDEKARIEFYRANIYLSLVNRAESEGAYTKVFQYGRQTGSAELQALGLGGLARFETLTGRLDRTAEYMRRCMEICERERLPHIEGQFIHMAGVGARWRGELREAETFYKASTISAPSIGDMRQAQVGHQGLVDIYRIMGDFSKARENSEQLLRLCNLTGERFQRANAISTIAHAQISEGRKKEAMALVSEEAEAIEGRPGEELMFPVRARLATNSQEVLRHLRAGHEMVSARTYGIFALTFWWNSILALVEARRWESIEEFCGPFERFMAAAPLPFGTLIIEYARVLASFMNGDRSQLLTTRLRTLSDEVEQMDLHTLRPLLEEALAACRVSP